ncbi:hypothetical protein BS47DRAFT_755133 [Hydnum rufescens UP504]|uniref:RanBD1 domain-containing protein n=1 Tax=Hydnum rufescens UP504 TaxID=1448309 RepID=A0A9P6DZA6_9AGAM|nr:hypothetical protein BS47DRAFT_755133 [Hydnum rufescens UP504]
MAKRPAVKQGGKDDVDDGDEEAQDVPTFNSNPEEIGKRKIKGLPKRAATATADASKNSANVAPVPKFSGFSGFGSTVTSTPPFSFETQSSQPSAASSAPPALSVPSATPSFPSFIPSSASDAERHDGAFEYYVSLRGLNHSLLMSFQEAVRVDPFADLYMVLSDALRHYQKHRNEIQNTFDSIQRKSQPVPAAKLPSPSAPPSLPVMPSTGFTFGGQSLRTPSPAPASLTSGFAFKPPGGETKPEDNSNPPSSSPARPHVDQSSTTSIGFSFGGAPEPQSKSASSEKEFKQASVSSNFGPFGARKADSSSSVPSESTATKSLDRAADSQLSPRGTTSVPRDNVSSGQAETRAQSSPHISEGSSIGTSSLSASSSTVKFDGTTSAAPAFPSWGASSFGSSSSMTSTSAFGGFGTKGAFSFKPPTGEPNVPSTVGDSSSSGAAGTHSFGSSGLFSTPSKPSPITFGSGSGSTKSPLFGASLSKTLGNPVGFAFGSPPKDNPFGTATPPEKTENLGESSTSASEGANLFVSTGKSGEDTPQSDPEVAPHDAAVADSEGEGEENEVALFVTRARLLKYGDNKWISQGTGFFKIKKNSETEKRRVLFRFDATKKVGANFNVFAGIKVTSNRTLVTFPGLEGETMITYGIKVATLEQARDAVAALEEAVAAVKGGN